MDESLIKYVAKLLAGSTTAMLGLGVVGGSFFEVLASMVSATLAQNIEEATDYCKKRLRADQVERTASAADKANKVTSERHVRRMEELEEERIATENAIKSAELRVKDQGVRVAVALADAQVAHLESVKEVIQEARESKQKAMLEAAAKELTEALKELQDQSGNLFLSPNQLSQLERKSIGQQADQPAGQTLKKE